MTVRQKMGIILENKVVQKLKLENNVLKENVYKSCQNISTTVGFAKSRAFV